ncbi:sterol desaturase family protein [Chitinimonas sp. BJYL2]|uniref:sterol desaturase family protein n=1 Tax=Chitinimonas sp. BJYL2 TaxID=2976696 RepID=UPI0022B5217B|nr:sterol desaturase family protein [Chitinimonas sp. BJYL2]
MTVTQAMHTLATLLVPTAFALMWLLERTRAARSYVSIPHWNALGIGFFILTAIVGSLMPPLLAATGFSSMRLLNLSGIGWWGLPIGLLTTSLVHYWWHRAEHRFNLFWRLGHQLHHSARRIDVAGAFVVHPVEVVIKTAIGVTVGSVLLGLASEVAAMVTALLAVISIFQHWNISTPRWLGWIIPRPEMHGLHHEFDIHARNYGDLAIWDILFGTYANPAHFDSPVGFTETASRRWLAMLLMRDVNAAGDELI